MVWSCHVKVCAAPVFRVRLNLTLTLTLYTVLRQAQKMVVGSSLNISTPAKMVASSESSMYRSVRPMYAEGSRAVPLTTEVACLCFSPSWMLQDLESMQKHRRLHLVCTG